MASDNDWYSDESDERHYRKKASKLWDELGELNNDIVFYWDEIRKKTLEVKDLEKTYVKLEEKWNCLVAATGIRDA